MACNSISVNQGDECMFTGITFYFVAIKTSHYRAADQFELILWPFVSKCDATNGVGECRSITATWEPWDEKCLCIVSSDFTTDGIGEVSVL